MAYLTYDVSATCGYPMRRILGVQNPICRVLGVQSLESAQDVLLKLESEEEEKKKLPWLSAFSLRRIQSS